MRVSAGAPLTQKTDQTFLGLQFTSRHMVFYVVFALLLAVLLLSSWTLGVAASKYRVYSRRHSDSKVMLRISTAVTATGEEAVALSTGSPCTEVCGALDERLDDLERVATRWKLPINDIRGFVEESRRDYSTQGSSFVAGMSAYNRATFLMTKSLREILASRLDRGSAAQLGLACVLQLIIPMYHRQVLQYPALLKRWDITEYEAYMGSTYSPYAFPSCSPYLPEIRALNVYALEENSSHIANLPSVSVDHLPTLDDSVFIESMRRLASLAAAYDAKSRSYCSRQMTKQGVTIALSVVSMIIALISIAFMPSFLSTKTSRRDETIRNQYQRVDNKAKLMPQFAHYVSTLKGESHLHAFLRDSFLCKIEGFVNRVRPLIPQTCFGDIEGVSVTDTGELAQSRDESGFASSSTGVSIAGTGEDEHRLQELRGDVGLQVAYGTFMCVAAAAHMQQDKAATGEELPHALTERMDTLVTAVEEIVNAQRGAVHSIAGDYIFVTWNVVSACGSSEANAFLSALKLANRFRDNLGGISISLASSPVIAGNFDANGHRTSVVLGPGQSRCEKLEMLNDYVGSLIMMDENVARKISATPLGVQHICVLPASVYRCVTDMERGPLEVAYAVYPAALQERHKAWVHIFRDFPSLLQADRFDEILEQIAMYRNMYLNSQASSRRVKSGGDNDCMDMAQTVDYWLNLVTRVKARRRPHSSSN